MQMWIEPFVVLSEFSQLSKLFIANVPVNWDALGILQLLDATPALELFHVHVLVCCFLTTQLTENVCASILTNNCFFLKPECRLTTVQKRGVQVIFVLVWTSVHGGIAATGV
jgi:hypothetical protein